LRYTLTDDGVLIVGSETGMVALPEERIIEKGRVGPGQMIALDLKEARFYRDAEIKDMLAAAHPYERWTQSIVELDTLLMSGHEPRRFEGGELRRRQLLAAFTLEDMELILHPMAEDAKEAVGSMGDDTPFAVLSRQYRPLSHFFRQNFSQVTNPPIDSLREDRVMSLKTRFGNLGNMLADDESQAKVYTLESPILTNGMFDRLLEEMDSPYPLDCTFDVSNQGAAPGARLEEAIARLRQEAEDAVRSGGLHLILSDERIGTGRAPIPMILAVGAVHSHLVRRGLRTFCSINVRSGECLDTHYFAVLIGCGATTVNAYLAQECLMERHARGLFGEMPLENVIRNYRKAVEQGLLKIISKLGISVISSYRGAYNFEAIGLSRALVADLFPGMVSRISGIGLTGLEANLLGQHAKAFEEVASALPIGGLYRYRAGGETHGHDGALIHLLQEAARTNKYEIYKRYAAGVYALPLLNLRDLMAFATAPEVLPIDEVESINEIRKRFVTPGMSLGALSPEAHRTLTIAMNRIGAKSDSGEGGEDPASFAPLANGDNPSSAIKQIASGRFGVTAEYLNNCREIEIKIAQGAKPGEGGQLPGFKVTEMIAKFRMATPGVMLISPPPHHDIYSIEDLAQLIYDLKQINPDALVCVKLVSSTGIGTIAAGVAKAKADVILISGHSGGTGASPQTSIKYAGAPWEMGLSETNQILTLNRLRHRVKLRVDGGIRTGRDVVIAALMGAEEFGVGTASLIAMGCILVRQCHSNTCPVGVCTQDEALREKFSGRPEHVVNLFSLIAQEVREILASLGARSLKEIIGRTDLLVQRPRIGANLEGLDLNPLLVRAEPGVEAPYFSLDGRNEVPDSLDAQIARDAAPFLEDREKMQLIYRVKNTDRAIGARTSSAIVRKYGMRTLPPGHLTVELRGSCGQSLGAFAVQGLKLDVWGDANDYVGKGLSGATILIRPGERSRLRTNENAIIGNTVLYGATAGKLFAAGQAGERFAVRNSGAVAVVEGCGANGCEYMTGGTVVILGPVGDNFGAGMTGGMAFVYDPKGVFEGRVNRDTVLVQRIASSHWEGVARELIAEHARETGSPHATEILARWDVELARFWQVCPKEMVQRLAAPLSDESVAIRA
jgi:glutamate synthase (NADPH/NADH) large chain